MQRVADAAETERREADKLSEMKSLHARVRQALLPSAVQFAQQIFETGNRKEKLELTKLVLTRFAPAAPTLKEEGTDVIKEAVVVFRGGKEVG